jgi:hypothetical protein
VGVRVRAKPFEEVGRLGAVRESRTGAEEYLYSNFEFDSTDLKRPLRKVETRHGLA